VGVTVKIHLFMHAFSTLWLAYIIKKVKTLCIIARLVYIKYFLKTACASLCWRILGKILDISQITAIMFGVLLHPTSFFPPSHLLQAEGVLVWAEKPCCTTKKSY